MTINNAQQPEIMTSPNRREKISALEEIRFENGRVYNYSAVVEAMIQSGFSDINPGEGGPFNPPVSREVAFRIKDAIVTSWTCIKHLRLENKVG